MFIACFDRICVVWEFVGQCSDFLKHLLDVFCASPVIVFSQSVDGVYGFVLVPCCLLLLFLR